MSEWSQGEPPTNCAVEMRKNDGVLEWRVLWPDLDEVWPRASEVYTNAELRKMGHE